MNDKPICAKCGKDCIPNKWEWVGAHCAKEIWCEDCLSEETKTYWRRSPNGLALLLAILAITMGIVVAAWMSVEAERIEERQPVFLNEHGQGSASTMYLIEWMKKNPQKKITHVVGDRGVLKIIYEKKDPNEKINHSRSR